MNGPKQEEQPFVGDLIFLACAADASQVYQLSAEIQQEDRANGGHCQGFFRKSPLTMMELIRFIYHVWNYNRVLKFPPERWQAIQDRRLRQLLHHAVTKSPFYRRK